MSDVLSFDLKMSTEVEPHSPSGSSFHSFGTAHENARSIFPSGKRECRYCFFGGYIGLPEILQ